MRAFVKANPTIAADELERLHKVIRYTARTTFDIDLRHKLNKTLEESVERLYEKKNALGG